MRATALALVISFFAPGIGEVQAQQQSDLSAGAPQGAKVEAMAWRQVAENIPLGSRVKIQTPEGKRINGTLMRVDSTSVMVKRNTRRPEPAITVLFDDISRLEHEKGGGGVNIGKAVAIGFATGAGVIVSLILFAMQFD
jgi:hypothetical protein